jgi:hypothetical protein
MLDNQIERTCASRLAEVMVVKRMRAADINNDIMAMRRMFEGRRIRAIPKRYASRDI